ncbi:RidA family protein [Geodermatophilus sp. SYSU D00708]
MSSTPPPLRPGVAAGGWLAISGQVGLEDGVLVEGPRAQTAQALANLRRVVESHGAGLADVVKTNVFLVTMDHYAVMNEEYAKVFAGAPPARSAVAVHQLPLGALVEIEAWVHLPGHRPPDAGPQ